MGALSKTRMTAAREHGAKPFVTDCTNGMRTELSGTVFEQWVAKTANWLEAEFGSGVLLHVELRPHWLWPVLVAALDELEGALAPADHADAVLVMGTRPGDDLPVIAVNDHPMAMPFNTPLPAHHLDFFREVRGGADVRPAGPAHDEPLLITDSSRLTARDLLGLVPAAEPGHRIALHVGRDPIRSAAQVAAIALMPWVSHGSLFITDGSSRIEGERTTLDVTLPDS
jgi:uncharacterized protein (TIGR03089 family)